MSLSIVLSGPERTRAKAEVALEDAGLALLPSDHHALIDWKRKFPDSPGSEAFVTVLGGDVDDAVRAVAKLKGWRLRVHYETPEKPEPSADRVLAATLDEMRAEIAALKARLA